MMKIRQGRNDYNLGKNIRRLRVENGLTQEGVVAQMQLLRVDISRGTYSQIECGISNIKVEELLALCKIFHCEIIDFFNGIELINKECDGGKS